MEQINTIGPDIATHVFQVHGVDAAGNVVMQRRLRRGEVLTVFSKLPSAVIGIEACATSHYWARELSASGHTVKLMPPHYVKPYVKRHKNDMTDAAAIFDHAAISLKLSDDGHCAVALRDLPTICCCNLTDALKRFNPAAICNLS